MANFPPRAGSGNQPSSQGGNPLGSQSGRPPGSGATPPAGAVTGMRTAGVRPCPSCSTLVNVHATVCPNCGEQIAAKEKMIRCRRCRHRASSNLVVCPHCGRELQPASSRWLTWGLPLLALLLLCGVLVVRAGRGDPSSWAQAQVDRVVRLVQSLGSRLQPDVTISMIPAGQDPNDPLVSQAAQAGAALSAAPPVAAGVTDVTAAGDVGAAAPPALESPTPAPTETTALAADAAAAAPTEPAAPATAVEPTSTPEPPTATPTQEPTNTPTNTPPPTVTATAAATNTPTSAATAPATSAGALAAAGTLTRTTATSPKTTITNTLASATSASAALTSTSTLTNVADAASTQVTTQASALLGLPTPTPVPPAPAATPTPAATATPTPLAVYEVRRGDTLFDIATKYDVSVDDLLAANDLTEDDVYTIQPGDELKIPAPTPEGGPTQSSAEAEAATATPAPATYTVRAGDTVLAIALRNDVSVEDMLAANGMTINDARTLQPGDELIIPGPEGVPTATPTATSTAAGTATATPTAAATAAPSPIVMPASVARVDAPRLRSPENGTAVSCSGQNALTWLQVPSVRPSDLYLVHLGYVNSVASNGTEDVVWVISQQRPVSATSWQLDNNLCGLAPNTAGKQWRWYVEVVEPEADGLQPVSPASPVWGFAWQ
jgi:LysM repeat protein/predicted RNA-binding Zn-ribbon protein involved in translation (DUF1610 family)